MSDTALVIMARYPQLGSIKKRLARTLGNEETLKLYQAFLSDLANHFSGQDYDLYWAYTPAEANFAAFITSLVPDLARYTHCFPTHGANLGEHLLHAFRWTHQQGYPTTIVIGSDTPHITREIIVQAQEALQEANVVLGPADDGGYYLIAMREPHDVFSNIPMSTSMVTARTIACAHAQGLAVRLIEPLFDVDEHADLLRLAKLLETNSMLAPTTATLITYLAQYMH
jgi:rSAM/selenodomain-associated transferase 1